MMTLTSIMGHMDMKSGQRTIYLAGPITGMPDDNRAAFLTAATALRARGYRVVNPQDLTAHDRTLPWALYMRWTIRAMLECDEVVLLPGWEQSAGTLLEKHVADAVQMPVRPWSSVLASSSG